MAKVTTPVKGFTGTVVGVDFKDGIGETDHRPALEYFERHGYEIVFDQVPDFPEGDPATSWTKDQLTKWAQANEVELGSASKKDEVFAAIEAHLTAKNTPPAG